MKFLKHKERSRLYDASLYDWINRKEDLCVSNSLNLKKKTLDILVDIFIMFLSDLGSSVGRNVRTENRSVGGSIPPLGTSMYYTVSRNVH